MEGIIEGSTTATGTQGTTSNGSGSGSGGRVKDPVHEANLERTIRELKRMTADAEATLNELKLNIAQTGSPPPLTPLSSLHLLTRAYTSLSESDPTPLLPFPDSVLPALLTLRKTSQTIAQTNSHLSSSSLLLDQQKRQLEDLKIEVREQNELQQALQARVELLRKGMEARKEMSLEEAAREELQKMEGERKKYDEETKKLVRELNWFIEEYLGPLLAAEEMGGPVVGEMMDLDAEDLEAGFNARGKLKKGRAKKTDGNEEGDKKQRRIDEIWGGAREDPEEGRERNGGKRKREGDEASAAGAEMRTLIEKLMNKSMDAGGDSSAAYVRIEKETAAARFLVRSKVAVFHPRDATRLRLVDFGRELDD
ncbi:unnamed protein product [Sordaria macrospora k-hell]|uniref:WGS project CABT00000000 data, contig 2.1 n=2 Tax=Sordaria macrospora TaxID=5147 RepID=F7VLW3_SORMK|nr:uncharacterized protein SMAC_04884 [Sordaria macrospora k-hell]KAH7627305.1 hypothetical protein B0T09DRAFT_359680 [Sordaria sp. MPI-SDFR-AT-0083]CCC06491.1 unnamed protein product [Sordaria macrospora k-hell]